MLFWLATIIIFVCLFIFMLSRVDFSRLSKRGYKYFFIIFAGCTAISYAGYASFGCPEIINSPKFISNNLAKIAAFEFARGLYKDAEKTYRATFLYTQPSSRILVGYVLSQLASSSNGEITARKQQIALLQKAVNLSPSDPYPRIVLADIWIAQGKKKKAIEYLQNFINSVNLSANDKEKITQIIARYNDVK